MTVIDAHIDASNGAMRMPAEWEPHEATLLTWPHRAEIWRGVHAEVEATFVEVIRELVRGERVEINIPNSATGSHVANLLERAGVERGRVLLHEIASDDVWARDHGPTVVLRDGPQGPERVMIDWVFNAWGDKYPSQLDDAVPAALAEIWGMKRMRSPLVMEGGALEVNGTGDLLTTEAVLLNPNRNPELSRDAITDALARALGVTHIHWLGDGLEGDDTDGHIDDIARFVDPTTVVVVSPPDDHPDAAVMRENIARLTSMTLSSGASCRTVLLPVPAPVAFRGEHLPASHANFYIGNEAVLVPTFGGSTDDEALEILTALFPSRRVVGIDCRALVSQYGAIHCITQQLPAMPWRSPLS